METADFIQTYYRERKQTDSLKWDALKERYENENLLPLWVADMDFSAPLSVQGALKERIEHGIFGYSLVSENYFSAYDGWQKRHEQTSFQPEWLHFTSSVVQGLYDLICCFTEEGDQIIVQPPVYYPFFDVIRDQKRQLVTSNLVETPSGYQMDLIHFERQLIENDIKLFILCSPHNPVGRVWSKEELKTILTLCQKYGVLVISDEIHSDLILTGRSFVSAVTVAKEVDFLDQLIVCNTPSKTFNLASLLNAHIWLPGEKLRRQYLKWERLHHRTGISVLGQVAAIAAYETGDDWLRDLLSIVEENYQLLQRQLLNAIPEIKLSELQGTYLAWLDLRDWLSTEADVKNIVQNQAKLAIDYGEWFSSETKEFIRINLATKPENIQKAITNLIEVDCMLKGGNRE